MAKGIYRLNSHCGNRGIWSSECMIGCDPGWCNRTPDEREADMVKHRESLAKERLLESKDNPDEP